MNRDRERERDCHHETEIHRVQEIAIGGHREWIQIQTEGDRPREIQRDGGRLTIGDNGHNLV